mgnify:CR=1 FL=1
MAFTRSFEGFAPPKRYDGLPFISVSLRESATSNGTYAEIDTFTLSPVDANPANPGMRNFTTTDATLEEGWYVIRWIDGVGSTFDSDPVRFLSAGEDVEWFEVDPPPAGTTYATATDLRAALGLDAAELPDSVAEDLLEDASGRIDSMLGVRAVNPDNGRKVTESEVMPWQWDRIVRATIKVASILHSNPSILTEQTFTTIKGPDFETTGPTRTGYSLFGDDVADLVNGSGLGVFSGRAR